MAGHLPSVVIHSGYSDFINCLGYLDDLRRFCLFAGLFVLFDFVYLIVCLVIHLLVCFVICFFACLFVWGERLMVARMQEDHVRLQLDPDTCEQIHGRCSIASSSNASSG